MNEAQQLLQAALAGLFIPVFLGVRAIRKKFATDPEKPTIHEGIIYGGLTLLALGLSYSQHTITAAVPTSVIEVWWVQGLLFVLAFFVTDVGSDATSTKSVSAVKDIRAAEAGSPPGVKVAIFGVLLLAVASPSFAQMNYPPLDMHRANFGVSVGARAMREDTAELLADPKQLHYDLDYGAQFAYSTGPAIAFVVGADYGQGTKVGSVGEGVSWALATDGVGAGLQLFARVRAVQYFGDHVDRIIGHKQSVDFALPISWRLHEDQSEKTAWYFRLIPVVDLRNPYRNSVAASLQLGYTPQPPQ